VANLGSNTVTVIDESQVQSVPLVAGIIALPDNVTGTPTPSFAFTATSSFAPNATVPDNLLFQLDTWQGPWKAAANLGGGQFSATAAKLQPGVHILYAYATDGQEATSTNTAYLSSPLIGNIAAYLFVVAPYPIADLAPLSLTFASQGIGTTSAGQRVTLTNEGGTPLRITSIAASGDYSTTSNCVATLQPGASCTIKVTLTPTVSGPDNGTLTVTDNSLTGPTQTVSLTGSGVSVKLNPATLSFAPQIMYTASAPQTVTLTNYLNSALPINRVVVQTGFRQTNTCGASVPALGTCTFAVVSDPIEVLSAHVNTQGPYSGYLLVDDGVPDEEQHAYMTGTGVAATLTPGTLTFAAQTVGTTSAIQTVTLTNYYDYIYLDLGAITITGSDPGDFAVAANTCGSVLAPTSACTITVNFTPAATGGRTAQLSVTDYVYNSPQLVTLTGTGQ
jgi:hypothetical protein